LDFWFINGGLAGATWFNKPYSYNSRLSMAFRAYSANALMFQFADDLLRDGQDYGSD
jgi:hypothetical protein